MMRGHGKGRAQQAQPTDRSEVETLRAEIEALKADRAAQPPQP
jgi:hypothetical protein